MARGLLSGELAQSSLSETPSICHQLYFLLGLGLVLTSQGAQVRFLHLSLMGPSRRRDWLSSITRSSSHPSGGSWSLPAPSDKSLRFGQSLPLLLGAAGAAMQPHGTFSRGASFLSSGQLESTDSGASLFSVLQGSVKEWGRARLALLRVLCRAGCISLGSCCDPGKAALTQGPSLLPGKKHMPVGGRC